MKTKIWLALLIAGIGAFALSGWNVTSQNSAPSTITNYYFYEGQPFYMNLVPNSIFFKFSKAITREEFNSIAGEYSSLFISQNIDVKEDQQIIALNTTLTGDAIQTMVSKFKTTKGVEYASPVFSMPEGKGSDKVRLGFLNEILVQFKQSMSAPEISSYISQKGFEILSNINISGGTSYVLRIPSALNAIDVANEVYLSGNVKFAEPNFYQTNLLQYMPNDTYAAMQWSIRNTGSNIPVTGTGTAKCDMRLDSAWDYTLGAAYVLVDMVDSGIDTAHEDIAANMVHGKSYNYYANTTNAYDDYNHGTCTGGIVAAVGNNAQGTSGVAPNCKLAALKIFNSAGSTTTAAIAAALAASWTNGGWISSNSWGGGSPDAASNQAITDGRTQGRHGKGTVYLFASGNGNTVLSWPSTQTDVISVGGVSPCNERKSPTSCDLENFWGANYGTNLHIIAPCVKIYAPDRMGSVGYDPTNYFSTFNGTSSATPNAAGVCALLLSLDSNLTWDTVRARLDRTADKVGTYAYTATGPLANLGATWNNEMGYGKINAYNLLKDSYNSLGPVFGHTPLTNTENLVGPYVVNATITSVFGAIDPTKTKVYWTRAAAFDSITMTHGSGNNWSASIPGNGAAGTYKYYLKAVDATGRTRTLPSNAPTGYYTFNVTTDLTNPVIANNPVSNTALGDFPPTASATVTDNLGVDSVWVKWYRNTTATGIKEFKLSNGGSGSSYANPFNATSAQVAINDSIFYRVYAQDISSNHNKDSSALVKFKIVPAVLNEGFTSAAFPPVNWTLNIGSAATQYWSRNTASSYAIGTGSAFYDFWTAPATTGPQSITSLSFNPTIINDSLKFDEACSYYSATAIDSCIVESSTDAGTTWTRIIGMYQSTTLSTGTNHIASMTTVPTTTQFLAPTAGQWATKTFGLPVGTNKVRFTAKSAFGNNLFIDSIQTRSTLTGITNLSFVPGVYQLAQNYPNPFNPATKISFNLPQQGLVTLKIYDMLGKEISTLVNEVRTAGAYTVNFDGSNLASGVYFYRLESKAFTDTKRMLLIK